MLIQKIKDSAIYKLIKTSEAVFMLGLPLFFYFIGSMTITASLVIMGAYLIINMMKYNNKPLYVLRDDAKLAIEQLIAKFKK